MVSSLPGGSVGADRVRAVDLNCYIRHVDPLMSEVKETRHLLYGTTIQLLQGAAHTCTHTHTHTHTVSGEDVVLMSHTHTQTHTHRHTHTDTHTQTGTLAFL